jgi:hypothetical protein
MTRRGASPVAPWNQESGSKTPPVELIDLPRREQLYEA